MTAFSYYEERGRNNEKGKSGRLEIYHRGCLLEKEREEPAAAKCLITPAPDATSEKFDEMWLVCR